MADASEMRDKVAIIGAGYTDFTKNSGKSTLGLALDAGYKAIQDAGIQVTDINGLASYSTSDSTLVYVVAEALGIEDTSFYLDHLGGGSASQTTIAAATSAIHAGLADYVLCYRALNSRSGMRMGGTGRTPNAGGQFQFQAPYGMYAPGQGTAMATRMHMHKYGTTKDQLGHIAVTSRKHACMNERAMMRQPISLEDYHNGRMISDPLNLYDYCLETDGSCAFVLTTAERARDSRHKPVYISGVGYGPGRTIQSREWNDPTESGGKFIAPRLFGMAGLTQKDVDVACLYDAFTYFLLLQLEDYGFCKKGEGGPFAASGALELDGELPTNPHGGHLSEGYIHGYNHVLSGVEQLRGMAGDRQVKDAHVALVTGAPGGSGIGIPPQCNALLLRS